MTEFSARAFCTAVLGLTNSKGSLAMIGCGHGAKVPHLDGQAQPGRASFSF